MANSLSQPILVSGERSNILYGDPNFSPTVSDSAGTGVAEWDPGINKWRGYQNTFVANGESSTTFAFKNNKTLSDLTSQSINNLNIDVVKAYVNNGTFNYRLNTEGTSPSSGAIQDGLGNADLTSVATGSAPSQSSRISPIGLKYPLYESNEYDFVQIECREYIPAQFASNTTSIEDVDDRPSNQVGSTIFLPMQPGISESNSVGWGQDQLNALQIAGAGIAKNAIYRGGDLDFGALASGLVMDTAQAARQLAGQIGPEQIATYFAGQAVGANIFTRGTGQVLNPNLELLFTGPNLRTFNYNYRFTPRDEDEAMVVKQIIKFFKKQMAPKRDSLFLSTPNVFKLKYIFKSGDQHPFLNKIKMCALTGFSVDYTPDGSYMTYQDGSMTSYSVSMQFNELNPIYHDDFEDSNDMGY
jgi:hypothetical protein